MWLLEADGRLTEARAPQTVVDADAWPESLPETAEIAVRFAATQDGRGFSRARRLREGGWAGRLVAMGPLEPDQARHAFQCGFDAVCIEDDTLARHGTEAWSGALATSVTELYATQAHSRLDASSIWKARAAR